MSRRRSKQRTPSFRSQIPNSYRLHRDTSVIDSEFRILNWWFLDNMDRYRAGLELLILGGLVFFGAAMTRLAFPVFAFGFTLALFSQFVPPRYAPLRSYDLCGLSSVMLAFTSVALHFGGQTPESLLHLRLLFVSPFVALLSIWCLRIIHLTIGDSRELPIGSQGEVPPTCGSTPGGSNQTS